MINEENEPKEPIDPDIDPDLDLEDDDETEGDDGEL